MRDLCCCCFVLFVGGVEKGCLGDFWETGCWTADLDGVPGWVLWEGLVALNLSRCRFTAASVVATSLSELALCSRDRKCRSASGRSRRSRWDSHSQPRSVTRLSCWLDRSTRIPTATQVAVGILRIIPKSDQSKRPVGRPPTFVMPGRINAEAEEIAQAFLKPPSKRRQYVKNYKELTR